MSKRIRNYRSGDRAEDLGVFLTRAFCAVAQIPRQEDFGLADAVATLLRPEGRFWYAEDSFLVQFKSRSEKRVKLTGAVFSRWLDQDLSVLLGRVNLVKDTIELFTLGTALFDRRIHEANGLVALLMKGKDGFHDGVLHLRFEKPILKWSAAETEDPEFIDRTYGILKQWISLERWNRRYFRAGVAREIRWETNQMPEIGEVVHTWTTAHGREALMDIAPLVDLLGLYAHRHPELWTRLQATEDALRGPNDPNNRMRHVQHLIDATERLADLVKNHPTSDAAVTVQVFRIDAQGASFWLHFQRRDGGSGQHHEGTWEELKQKGFDCSLEGAGPDRKPALSLDRFFASLPTPHEVVDGPEKPLAVGRGDHSPCFFLRRLSTNNA